MCAALAVVTGLIRIYTFPFGGSVTLFSMLFIVLPAWFYGVREGIIVGLIAGIVQFFMEPFFISVPQFILDYMLAFTVMGIAGFFRTRKKGLIIGYAVGVIARWIIATLAGLAWFNAGMAAWDAKSPLPYSMAYNAAYIFAEAIVTIIILFIPAVNSALDKIRHSV